PGSPGHPERLGWGTRRAAGAPPPAFPRPSVVPPPPPPAPPASPAYLVAPVLARAILAALDEILRRAGEPVVGLAEGRHPSVAVVVEPDIKPHLRHPLGMAHGACPGAAHLLGRASAALDGDECVEQLLLPIGAAARLSPRERRERGENRTHVVLLHVRIA